MELKVQKRLAAKLLKCSPKKIWIDSARLEEIKESITKKDIHKLIKDKAIKKKRLSEHSRAGARKVMQQKRKGKRKGPGSRKGKKNSTISKKGRWTLKIRAQRKLLKELVKGSRIDSETYNLLYIKSKGGFFRSRRHIMLYLDEHNLIKK
ncbi:50S ribosomal protein L19e [Candidatus Woesearchaeota archaeon]|nr:50S ribosomal protein L19e [Candidatus Woesearchaeota archaeon]